MVDDETARQFLADSNFVWHQRFHLSEEVTSPGAHDIEHLLERVGFPSDLSGASVLDIGTSNGGSSFIAERRGADRIVAVDIYDPEHFGFRALHELLNSRVEYVKASIYELPQVLSERFDVVLFLGVLYHLRHPLLALDNVRRLCDGTVYVESEVSGLPDDPVRTNFYRRDELAGDGSNWFVPTVACLVDWVESSGFECNRVAHWPENQPTRAMTVARSTAGDPEFIKWSYEVPISVRTSSEG